MQMDKKMQQRVLCGLASIALALTYIAIGFAICAGFPQITRVAALGNSMVDESPYAPSELINLAEKTRTYTIEDAHRSDAGIDDAHELFADEILTAARASVEDPERTSAWNDEARQAIEQWSNGSITALEAMDKLYRLDPAYALSTEALTHLDDVNDVINRVKMPLLGCTLIAAFCLMSLVLMFGARPAGRALLIGGCIAVAAFIILGLWGIIGFDTLFAWMHTLFFVEGTWTFPANSLLIEMYPIGFWVSLGAWWLGSSCVVAVASIIIGLVILKRKPTAEKATPQPAGLQA